MDIVDRLRQTHDRLIDLDFKRLGRVCLDAMDEIEHLRAEIERKSEANQVEPASQAAEIARLREALAMYGRHQFPCDKCVFNPSGYGGKSNCTCGLEQALIESRP
jgi:hypothetical protein